MPRLLARAVACATLLLMLASPVLAHSALVSASPGPDEKVVGSPTELVAQFSQDLDPSRTSMSVRDSAGKVLARGGEPGKNKREFRLALPELAPGTYQVRYTTFSSEDGELHRSDYKFTVVAAPSPSPSPSPTATSSATAVQSASPSPSAAMTPASSPSPSQPTGPTSGTDGDGALVAIILAVVVLGAFGAWFLRRRAA